MKQTVKNNIIFERNDANNYSVNIYENDNLLGCISTNMYNILSLINSKEVSEAIKLLMDYLKLDYETSKTLYNKLLYAFDYILHQGDSTHEPLFYSGFSEKINPNRIRSLVPKFLVLSISRECFMKCRYCYAGAKYVNDNDRNSNNDLRIDIIKKICEEAKSIGISKIDLTGGDPYIRSDICEIFDLFDRYDILTSLSTKKNLDDTQIEDLKRYKCIEYVQISVDTLDDNIQELLICEKSYASKRVALVKKLLKNNIKVKVNSVLTKHNVDTIFELIGELNQIGVDTIALSPYSNNLYRHNDDLLPSYEQYYNLSKKISKHSLNIELNYPIFLNKFDETGLYGSMSRTTCGAGLDGLVVGPTGDAFICERLCYDTNYSLGNCKKNTLMDIWMNTVIDEYIKPNNDRFVNTKCYNCDDFNFCVNERGICYVHSLILNGTIYSPDMMCKLNKGEVRIF